MTKQDLEILLEHVATWPEEAQDELVQSLAGRLRSQSFDQQFATGG